MNELTTNSNIEKMKKRLRPKHVPSHLVSGMMIALATIYEVSTHAASSTPADRLPRIWNNATFAIVVSSTSMMVASITAIATSHLLAAGTLRAVWIAVSAGAAATGQPAWDRVI